VLDSWTATGAQAVGLGDWTGTLAVGRRADLVVFDRDLLSVPVGELPEASAVLTVAGGAVVHET
jgi:predicted amidohydrolase YtcJ